MGVPKLTTSTTRNTTDITTNPILVPNQYSVSSQLVEDSSLEGFREVGEREVDLNMRGFDNQRRLEEGAC